MTFLVSIQLPDNSAHECYDPTHKTCDGYCVCDGFECTDIDHVENNREYFEKYPEPYNN